MSPAAADRRFVAGIRTVDWEPVPRSGHFPDRELWRNVMRMFLVAVGVLAWLWALAVLWIFAESGGALTVIAAGVFAIVAVVALACERIIKTLEDIRDGSVTRIKVTTAPTGGVPEREAQVRQPLGTQSA
jgi:hypothetical protein